MCVCAPRWLLEQGHDNPPTHDMAQHPLSMYYNLICIMRCGLTPSLSYSSVPLVPQPVLPCPLIIGDFVFEWVDGLYSFSENCVQCLSPTAANATGRDWQPGCMKQHNLRRRTYQPKSMEDICMHKVRGKVSLTSFSVV